MHDAQKTYHCKCCHAGRDAGKSRDAGRDRDAGDADRGQDAGRYRVWVGVAYAYIQRAHTGQIDIMPWWAYVISALAILLALAVAYVLLRELIRLVLDKHPPRELIVRLVHADGSRAHRSHRE